MVRNVIGVAAPCGSASFDSVFPEARRYREPGVRAALRDETERPAAFRYSERHVQCIWFDPSYRPPELRTLTGERVIVEDPGVWNLGPGPDFRQARLRVEPGSRRMQGDVEVHVHPGGWRDHGHAGDPAYRDVCLHVTWFPGHVEPGLLPAGALEVSLAAELQRDPAFSFEMIDPAAYPYGCRADEPPCRREMAGWSGPEKRAVLEAAGQERLRRKAEILRDEMQRKGLGQVWYEEVLAALGYRRNRNAARRLAVSLPLARLRNLAGGCEHTAYALLAGAAGLLPDEPEGLDAEAAVMHRTYWNAWWKHRGDLEDAVLPAGSWTLQGLRPLNRPERRLAAAARMVCAVQDAESRLRELAMIPLPELSEHITSMFEPPEPGFWHTHTTWTGKTLARPAALVGKGRMDALIVNVVVPLLASIGSPREWAARLDGLPVEPMNEVLKQTAYHLFGPDMPSSHLASGCRRQGLIQIFRDFCLQDRARCGSCPFPGRLRTWKKQPSYAGAAGKESA